MWQELVDVGGDRLVEVVLLHVQLERDRMRVAVREQPTAVAGRGRSSLSRRSAQGQSGPSLQDVAADLGGLVAEAMRLWERSGVDQPDEMGEAVVVAVVRRGGQQEQVVGRWQPAARRAGSASSSQPRLPGRRDALGVGAALVGLVDDDEVPSLLPDPLAHVVLLGVVHRGDDLVAAVPGVDELLLIDGREDDVERLAEPAKHLVLPLDGQRRGAENQHPVDGLAELHLLDEQAGHDGLAGAGIVRQQEPQPGLREHPEVDRLDLVRKSADARKAHGKLAIVRVGQTDAGRLYEEPEALGVHRLDRGRSIDLLPEDGGCLVAREDGFVRCAAGQTDATLKAVAQRRGRILGPLVRRNGPAG